MTAHAAGHDSDDPWVPILAKEHNTGRIGKLSSRALFSLFGYAPLDTLPLFVHLVELLCNRTADSIVVLQEKINRERSVG